MRFTYPDNSIVDVAKLKDELCAAGLEIEQIHRGNGILIFDGAGEMTDAILETAIQVIAAHSPLVFVWQEGAQERSALVRAAWELDRITSMRIRQLFGDDDPVQGQLKILTGLLCGLKESITGASDLAALKASTAAAFSEHSALLSARSAIIEEGRSFKTANNL